MGVKANKILMVEQEQEKTVHGYRRTSPELLLKGQQVLEEGDLLEASEKFWGAASHMVKAIAEQRGWRHRNHSALYQIVGQVATELGDEGLRDRLLEAGQFHTNFYENWLDSDTVRRGGERVRELVDILEQLL